jgi:predicted Zn-dependent protease
MDPKAVTARAIDLCQRSDNPVAVEPGRYTVILEPEAVAQLLANVTGPPTTYMDAASADLGFTVYSKKEGGSKLGLKMMDERVQVFYDPMDPIIPFSPLAQDGSLYSHADWFKNGILTNLAWEASYAKKHGRAPLFNPGGRARFAVDGPTETLEEMIAGTKRGIWIHHLAATGPVNGRTLLLTGVTCDGTFLIENGKVAKSIKNLRFNESPFFFMNKIDAFGPAVRGSADHVAPRLKVHDFEFTSLSDAV